MSSQAPKLSERLNDSLPDVNEGWSFPRLKHITQINPDTLSGDEPNDWEIEYVDISSVNSIGEIKKIEQMSLKDAPSRAQRLVQDGDTIVSTVRTYLKAIAYVEEPPSNLIVSTGFAVIRPNDEIQPRFLWRVLQADPFVEWIVANSKGVSYPAINPSRLGDLVIPVPPAETQERIADFLDDRTARIDALIKKKKYLSELLEEKKWTTITQAVTKGVDVDREFKYPDKKGVDKIPTNWELLRLDHLRDPHTPIVYGIVLPGPDQDEGVPIIKGGDCKPEKLDPEKLSKTTPEIAADYERSRLNPGELVFEIRGSVGRVVKVPPELEGANLTQDTARIAPKDDVDADWLLYALQSEVFRQQMDLHTRGATVQGVNLYDLRRGVLPVPPLKEQKQIAQHLEKVDERIQKIRDRIEIAIELLKEKRQALITRAVTGQIDVTDAPAAE